MKIGTVLKLEGSKAIIMTCELDFLFIKRRSNMYVGQQVLIQKSDIIYFSKESDNVIVLWRSNNIG